MRLPLSLERCAMKVVYIRDSNSRGYLRIGISDGEKKKEYTVSESQYTELGSPLSGDVISDVSALEVCDMRYRGKLYALRILSFADNNAVTLKRKLIAKSISPAIASEICEEMIGLGYINENRQLEKLIENEINVKLSGRRKVLSKLLSKGYRREEVESVLDGLISAGTVDFELSKQRLIRKKFPDGATEKDIRNLLHKNGYTDFDFSGDI